MVASSWFTAGMGALGLLLSADGVTAARQPRFHFPSLSPVDREVCPERCIVSGPNPGNWSVYPDFKPMKKCTQTMFYDFNLYDQVDNPDTNSRIAACTSFGPDFSLLPPNNSAARIASAEPVNVDFEVGWQEEGFGLAASGIRSLLRQLRRYIDNGHGATDRPFIIYAQSGQATVGLYIGQGLQNQALSESALKILQYNLDTLNVETDSLAMQLCGPGYDSTHIFGVMVTSNATFAPIQDAIKTWANATCLSFAGSKTFAGQAMFTTPLLPTNGTVGSNSTIQATGHGPRHHRALHARAALNRRAECESVQVESGDSCASLATKCGISGSDFTKLHPDSDFCASLKPKQHVCCTTGDLPDFRPVPNSDGSCFTYQVKAGDNCANLGAEYGLTNEDIEGFNQDTWGWNGCELLFTDTKMCLSEGNPPFPAPIANAVCGPQKPGSKPPTDGSNIADLNPCPLNACCNIWGQCGITKDFCVDTNTGAPGTAKPGTYGCISNCGTDIVKGDGSGAIKVAYFEGFNLGRDCLFQDASQIDTSQYTHIHFGFATLTPDYEVEVGDVLSSYQFEEFTRIRGAKRILSFGGWDFSTLPATYFIFREGVTAANRLKMATNIANFIKEHDLDGVDIDWEYPGAPDIPDIPPASPDDGPNYLAFLVVLKNLLPGKSVSIAAPSSYWYLKQYPLKQIGAVVDYIVYMTYDLHGQWDANNGYSQEGCENGNCLRSQVNLTETKQSLAMITKAGVPGRKVIVGVTSYGRSFEMAQPGCWGPTCPFTGTSTNSNAKKGVCTGTAGYLADAEIAEIMAGTSSKRSSRVVVSFVDAGSNSDILVYDGNQYVAYMSVQTKNTRMALYAAWGMGGTTDWASDLQNYNPAPFPSANWTSLIKDVRSGKDPKGDDGVREGIWTQWTCNNDYTRHWDEYTSEEIWKALDADTAWDDAVREWKDHYRQRPGFSFMDAVGIVFGMGGQGTTQCGELAKQRDNCDQTQDCPASAANSTSGPAAQLVWNSLVWVHEVYHEYFIALHDVAGVINMALDDMEKTFAPVPPPPNNKWLFLLIDLLTLGTLSVAGPFFNTMLKSTAYFAVKEASSALDNIKDTTMNLVGQSTTIAKDVLPSKDSPWTAEAQDKFSNYMGQAITGWTNTTALALKKVFDGSDESVDLLGKVMSDGKLIRGSGGTNAVNRDNGATELRANIAKSFFGYAIPSLWRVSKTYAFVLDSGISCDTPYPVRDYLTEETMDATGSCVDGRWYFLVHPKDGSKFSAPPGIERLHDFGGISKDDLIKGSVRTYNKNGQKNGGLTADPHDGTTIDNLLDVDITTPGYVRLPVCSPERAFQSWDTSDKGSSENYPCDFPPGMNHCGDSTFEGRTSDASPLVEDCLQIIRNIQGDASTDWTPGIGSTKEIKANGCTFAVVSTAVKGSVTYKVGGQDLIDIINEAVNRFGGDGKVGAEGDMTCKGNAGPQPVHWSIY
ncbi:hypothetical protein QBC32DRAFT_251260 [Pseudoneurospora amorphoporcata]|uniref:chitinase n=1 Tax=Pseudoneurospora amorphoporcata TaxID=241081 RepID=A0AAN6SKA7_9PEZI|nr:hypothetical protein QBC32DRAFT_251260 [Pseudoneurospora amorphoporcata]